MYETMIVVVFDSEGAAYEGSNKLRELHQSGDLTVYADAVIAKDRDGQIHIRKTEDEGPIGMAVGSLVGAMVGMLAGPAGVAIGMLSGMAAGAIRDVSVAGVNAEFLNDVGLILTPGKSAVVAEITEVWRVPLDRRMKAAGGTVFRRPRVDVVDEQLEREAEALKAEYDAIAQEWEDAGAEAKAEAEALRNAARAKLEAQRDRVQARIEEVRAEANAKLDSLAAQINTATTETKVRFEQRRSEIEADLKDRKAKLERANQLIGEALIPAEAL
jgi:uncharacterized membrane protein